MRYKVQHKNTKPKGEKMAWGDEVQISTGGIFLKLDDGESAEVVVCGSPRTREAAWKDGTTSERAVVLAWHVADGAWRVWEMAHRWFQQLKAVAAQIERSGAQLDAHTVRVRRIGTDTQTIYVIDTGGPVTPAIAAAMAAVPRPHLEDVVDSLVPLRAQPVAAPPAPPALPVDVSLLIGRVMGADTAVDVLAVQTEALQSVPPGTPERDRLDKAIAFALAQFYDKRNTLTPF